MLTVFVSEQRNDCDLYAAFCMMAYYLSVHQSTGLTPATMFVCDVRLPIDLVFGKPELENAETKLRYGTDYVQRLEEANCLKFIALLEQGGNCLVMS